MKYANEIDSGSMMYILSLRNIGSGIQKLIREDTETLDTQATR
jgi:hypothetical protein